MANKSSKGVKSAPEDLVAQVAARRQADEAKARENIANVAAESLVFTDMSEFVQGINAQDNTLDEVYGEEMPDVPPPPPSGGEDEPMEDDMPDVPPPPPPEKDENAQANMPVLAEKHVVQKGLASTLALLKDKAQLDDAQNTRWSGRANDMKDRFDKQHVLEAHAIEEKAVDGYKFGFKLDKFDEFGRKLTPKEAFRELCHRFHGIEPGKMKREKRLRQFQEEQQRLKASSVMDDRVKEVQREQATPYVVLSGHVSAGQVRNADPMATLKREQESVRAISTGASSRGPPSASGLKASNATKVSFAMKPSKK
jgi:U4/U6.U5 tri-snRNP-associated protein 1